MPARSANHLAGRIKDEILVKLQEEIARIMEKVPAWNVADFRPADSVIAGLKSELKEHLRIAAMAAEELEVFRIKERERQKTMRARKTGTL